MSLIPIKQHYKADNLVLPSSAAKVNGIVITKDSKVYCTEGNMRVTTADDKAFSFRLNQNNTTPGQDETWNAPTMSTDNVPAGVSAETIANEFVAYVEAQINS